ncbi:MAG: glycosyltransferase family protein [Pirellulaceae bacterium]
MTKTVVIIQARVGSTRLPRKVLLSLGGQTVLSRVIDRVRRCRLVDQIVVATTDQAEDDVIVEEVTRCGTVVTRGSQDDVLSRYCLAATETQAHRIIRITSDCPLVDPDLIDLLITRFDERSREGRPVDYLSNTHPRTFPHGLDAEMFTIDALRIANQEATERFEREHVTPFFYLNPTRFRLDNIAQAIDQSKLRWTLDEPADFRFFERVFASFAPNTFVDTAQVLDLLARNPEISNINSHVEQKHLKAA